jgi:hypothetical protein
MMEILPTIKLILYVWAIAEVASLAHLYLYAYKEGKRSPVLRGLFFLLVAFTISLVYRFMFSYTVHIVEGYHTIFRHGVMLPLILIIVAARHFRYVSTKKEEEIKNLDGD